MWSIKKLNKVGWSQLAALWMHNGTNSNNPYCISTGACVACLSDSNCSGTTPVCVDGICQGKF